jgi:hypothetical protein
MVAVTMGEGVVQAANASKPSHPNEPNHTRLSIRREPLQDKLPVLTPNQK